MNLSRTRSHTEGTRPEPEHGRGESNEAVSASIAVYDVLHREIVSMILTPGMPLSERALITRFGVSRTPVREALIRLVEDGLVTILPRSATFVAPIRVAKIPEAVVIRQSLEAATVERAAINAEKQDISILDRILKEQERFVQMPDPDLFLQSDDEFHEAIARISGLQGIWSYLKPARAQIERPRRMSLPELGRSQTAIREHVVIRDAIASGSFESASAAMKQHLAALVPDLRELQKRFPDFFE